MECVCKQKRWPVKTFVRVCLFEMVLPTLSCRYKRPHNNVTHFGKMHREIHIQRRLGAVFSFVSHQDREPKTSWRAGANKAFCSSAPHVAYVGLTAHITCTPTWSKWSSKRLGTELCQTTKHGSQWTSILRRPNPSGKEGHLRQNPSWQKETPQNLRYNLKTNRPLAIVPCSSLCATISRLPFGCPPVCRDERAQFQLRAHS